MNFKRSTQRERHPALFRVRGETRQPLKVLHDVHLKEMSSRTSKPARLKECSPLFLRLSMQNCRPKNRLVVSGHGYHRHKMDRLGFLQNVKPQGGKNEGRVFSSCERNQGQVLLHKQLQFEERTENNSWPLKKAIHRLKPHYQKETRGS